MILTRGEEGGGGAQFHRARTAPATATAPIMKADWMPTEAAEPPRSPFVWLACGPEVSGTPPTPVLFLHLLLSNLEAFLVKVMSAHCSGGGLVSIRRRDVCAYALIYARRKGIKKTHVVQRRSAVGHLDDLDGRIGALRDVELRKHVVAGLGETELAASGLVEAVDEGDVEGCHFVSEAEVDVGDCPFVAELGSELATSQRPLGPVVVRFALGHTGACNEGEKGGCVSLIEVFPWTEVTEGEHAQGQTHCDAFPSNELPRQ